MGYVYNIFADGHGKIYRKKFITYTCEPNSVRLHVCMCMCMRAYNLLLHMQTHADVNTLTRSSAIHAQPTQCHRNGNPMRA